MNFDFASTNIAQAETEDTKQGQVKETLERSDPIHKNWTICSISSNTKIWKGDYSIRSDLYYFLSVINKVCSAHFQNTNASNGITSVKICV